MKLIIVLTIFINYIAVSSDWRLVERFDNTSGTIKSVVKSIECFDSDNCYAIVQHATKEDYGCRLYYSTDGGNVWELINTTKHDSPYILNVNQGISPNPGYYFLLSDDDTFLEKSTDGGKTFKTIVLDDSSDFGPEWSLHDLAMYDTNRGFVTNGFAYFKTKDGWETFVRHPKLSNDQVFYSPIFMDSNTIVMASFVKPPLDTHNHMAFMKYHLKEDTWDTLFYFGAEYKKWLDVIENIYLVNDSLGFGCGTGVDFSLPSGQYLDIIYKTTDGGNNWELIYKELVHPEKGLMQISFADENNGVAVGYWGKISMTNDGGNSWIVNERPPEITANTNTLCVTWAGRTPLIGTWDAGIFRYEGDFFKFPISVKEILRSTDINIRQTPEKLLISIEDENFRKYKLQISDIMGNIVLEQVLNSGIGTLFHPVDISGLTNGAYLYMISTGGIIAKTGKLLKIENY